MKEDVVASITTKLASKSVNKSMGYEDKVTKSDDSTIE